MSDPEKWIIDAINEIPCTDDERSEIRYWLSKAHYEQLPANPHQARILVHNMLVWMRNQVSQRAIQELREKLAKEKQD